MHRKVKTKLFIASLVCLLLLGSTLCFAQEYSENLSWLGPLQNDAEFRERAAKMISLTKDPTFERDCRAIIFYPHRAWLLLTMGAFFLISVVIRHKVLSTTNRWWMRFLLRIPILGLFLLGEGLIAYAFLGEPFVDFSRAIASVVF